MKLFQDDLFPTRIFLVDDLLEEEYVDSMRKDIIKSAKENPRVNWQSHPRLQHEKKYKALVKDLETAWEEIEADPSSKKKKLVD